MQKVIQVLMSEISQKETELASLREALASFKTMGASPRLIASEPVVPDGPFEGQTVGAAVLMFMQGKKVATAREIRETLDRGGMEWGKYPKRQVKLAVVNSPKLYSVKRVDGGEDDIVTLI